MDSPTRNPPRFMAADVVRVTSEIGRALGALGVGATDLAICSGMTESEIGEVFFLKRFQPEAMAKPADQQVLL
ncbi:MAG TPA: hypothetical protein VGI90_03260 [Steroidobacteraceae bacterium]